MTPWEIKNLIFLILFTSLWLKMNYMGTYVWLDKNELRFQSFKWKSGDPGAKISEISAAKSPK